MTYKEKVNWLLSYRRQRQKVEEMRCEVEEMQRLMQEQREGLGQGSGDLKKTRQAKESEAVQQRQKALAKEQRCLLALGDAAESAIQRLEEPRQRRVLRLIYLGGMSQNQLCEQLHYCKRQVSRCHAEGVNALQLRPEEVLCAQGVGKEAKA